MKFLKTKHQKKSFIITSIIYAMIILLMLVFGFKYFDPPKEKGIAVNFGTTEFGSGDVQPNEPIKTSPQKNVPEPTPVDNESDQSFILKINQLNQEDNFSVRLAYLDVNNQISQSIMAELNVMSVGTGTLQVSLSFDNDKDIDLHLIEPNGDHIYYGSMMSTNGGELDLDSNPACSIDGVNNENITYSEDAQLDAGTYYVYVDMYSNCDPSIATNFVASVYLNGVEIPTSTQNPYTGNFPIDFPSNSGGSDIENDIDPIFSFTVSEDASRPMPDKIFKPKPLTQSALEKLEISKNR